MQLGRDRLGNLQQFQFLAPCLLETLHHLRLLEGTRGMTADCLQQRHVDRGKRARALVQHLGHADDLVGAVAQWDAQYAAREISGAPVDFGIEPRVPVGIVDDFGRTRAEYRARDADVLRDPDLRHGFAAGHPREQLAGIGIMQKECRALGVERLGNELDQMRQLVVERKPLGDGVGDLDEHREPPDCVIEPVRRRRLAAEDGG